MSVAPKTVCRIYIDCITLWAVIFMQIAILDQGGKHANQYLACIDLIHFWFSDGGLSHREASIITALS